MKDINALIASSLTEEITPEEYIKLEKWMDENPSNRLIYEKLKLIWKEDAESPVLQNTEVLKNKLWSESVGKGHQSTWMGFKKKGVKSLIQWAASIVLLLGSSWYAFYLSAADKEPTAPVKSEIVRHHNPSGQKSKIQLTDGSVVWLNAFSTVVYEKGFNDSVRNVELIGEAFFEVARDPSRKFTITTDGVVVTAYGTSFNVCTYPQDDFISISLVTGKVGVKTFGKDELYMTPGRMLTYNKERSNFKEEDFVEQDIIGWKDGLLTFKADTYKDFARKVERWYGLSVKTEGQAPDDWELTASFRNQSLELVLKNIQFQKDFKYEFIDGDIVVLKF